MVDKKETSKNIFSFLTEIRDLFHIVGWKLVLFLITLWAVMKNSHGDYLFIITMFIFGASLPLSLYKDKSLYTILLFSISYVFVIAITGQVSSGVVLLGYLLGPAIFYTFGKFIVNKLYGDDYLIINFLLISAFAFLVHHASLVASDIRTFGFVNIARSIETQDNGGTIAATLYGLVASIGYGGLAAFLIIPNKIKSITAWLYLLLFVVSITMTLHLVNRSGLYVAVFTIFTVVQYISRFNIARFLLLIGVIFVTLYLLYKFDVISEDVFAAYEFREEQTVSNSRIDRWIYSMGLVFNYPFGWSTDPTVNIGYAHNLWLDVARKTGLLPFIIIIIATFRSVKMIFKSFKLEKNVVIGVILSLYVSIFCAMFVEPALDACSYIVYFFIMLWGMMQRYIHLSSDHSIS